MLANWVKETTTTTGTGTMTLAGAATGFIAFTDAFNDGDKVFYSIESGNNREIGVGTFTASGTTLSRDTILETLVSGTYDNTSPTAITLAGTSTVACTAMQQIAKPSPMGTYLPSTKRIMSAHHQKADISTVALTANTVYYYPFCLEEGMTIASLGVEISAAAAGNGDIGIYSRGVDGKPGSLLTSTGSFSVNTTGHVDTSITNEFFRAGNYFMAIVAGVAPTVTSTNNQQNNTIGSDDNLTPLSGFTESSSTLPASAGTLSEKNNKSPIPYMVAA